MHPGELELAIGGELRGMHGGEPPALQVGRLYEEHHRMVGTLCRLLLRDPIEAEDAAQQTFLSAFRAIIAGTVPRHPGPWLATIARRECWARTAQRKRQPLPLEDAADPEAGSRDPLERAIEQADVAALWRAIDDLPRRQRKAFLLREFSGLSYAELAVALGVTESAIEALLVRARRQLRDTFTLATGETNLALAPLALLQHRVLRIFAGGNPAVRAGAATAVGLPVAAKLTATTAFVVVIGSVGVGLKATVFDHRSSRPSPAASSRASLRLPSAKAPGERSGGRPIRQLPFGTARAATRTRLRPKRVPAAQWPASDGSGGAFGGSPTPGLTARSEPSTGAPPGARRSEGGPVAEPTAPDTTEATTPESANGTPTGATPNDASPSDATSTDGSQTDTTTSPGSAGDTTSTDASQTDASTGDAPSTS